MIVRCKDCTLQLRQKLLSVYDKACVAALADESLAIVGLNLEIELTAINLYELGTCLDIFAHLRSLEM